VNPSARSLALLASVLSLRLAAEGPPAESGKYLLFVNELPAGEETWTLLREADGTVLSATFRAEAEGQVMTREATLSMKGDLTPRLLRLSRPPAPELRVEAGGLTALASEGKSKRKLPVPARVFAISGSAPIAVVDALFRYTQKKGAREAVALLPAGSARLELRGRETFASGALTVPLDRWELTGIAKGRAFLFTDPKLGLVAFVGRVGAWGRFAAVREGYEGALKSFVQSAMRAGVDASLRAALAVSVASRNAVAIFGARLVDGTGRPSIPDAIVVISGDRIVAAGPRRKVTVPKGSSFLDAQGRTILPGLWDMDARVASADDAVLLLSTGVTSAYVAAEDLTLPKLLRDAAAPLARVPIPSLRLELAVTAGGAAGADERLHTAVARCRDAGCAALLLGSGLEEEERRALSAEAKGAGLSVFGRLTEPWTAPLAGLDALVLAPRAGKAPFPVEPLRALRESGPPIVAGSEGAGVVRAAELLVAAGASPVQAIRELSAIPARLAGESERVGTVEPGKRADLVIVEGNAARSVQALRKVGVVILHGLAMNPQLLKEQMGLR
jgi:hypothetical protein